MALIQIVKKGLSPWQWIRSIARRLNIAQHRAATDFARQAEIEIKDRVLGPRIYMEGSRSKSRPTGPQKLWRRSGALADSIRSEVSEKNKGERLARIFVDADALRSRSGSSFNYAVPLQKRHDFLNGPLRDFVSRHSPLQTVMEIMRNNSSDSRIRKED